MWTHDYTLRTLSAKHCNLRDPVQAHMHTETHANRHTHAGWQAKACTCEKTKGRSISFLSHTRTCTHWHPRYLACAAFVSPVRWDFSLLTNHLGFLGADSQNQQWQHTLTLLSEGLEGHVSLWLARALSRLSGHFAVHQGLSKALVKWREGTLCVPWSGLVMYSVNALSHRKGACLHRSPRKS